MTRRFLACLAVALLALVSAAAAPPAASQAVPHGASQEGATLLLTSYGPAVITPTDMLTVGAAVSNPSEFGVGGLSVSLAVTTAPITSSPALTLFLDDPTSAPTRQVASLPVGVLGPGATGRVTLSAGPTALGFPVRTSGVYGVVIAVRNAAGTVASRSAAVTWYDAPISPLHIAVIATASGSAERVARVVAAASTKGVTLVVDPIAMTDAGQAQALAGAQQVFGLPSGDPDLTSIAHSSDRTLLDFALADAKANAPPPLQNLPWLATIPVVDARTIALAYGKGAVAGLLDATGGATIATTAPVADVHAGDVTLPVLVPNRDLSELLATYRPGMPDAPARLVAQSAILAQQGDGSTPVVVAPGSAWLLPDLGASASISELLSAPWVLPVTARSVLDGEHRARVDAPDSAGSDTDLSPDLVKALARQLQDVDELARTAADPSAIYLPGGRALLAPLATSLRRDGDAREATFQHARDTANDLLSSLHVAVGSDVNLIAASGNVPVTLRNDLSVDATVTVVMRSNSPNLVVQDKPVVTVPAGADLTVHIPVTAVKSANVTTTVALENSQGEVVAPPQAVRVRVRADWGNAITVVFAVGLALLLVAGLVRTVRRGRGSTRVAPMPLGGERGDTGAGGDDG